MRGFWTNSGYVARRHQSYNSGLSDSCSIQLGSMASPPILLRKVLAGGGRNVTGKPRREESSRKRGLGKVIRNWKVLQIPIGPNVMNDWSRSYVGGSGGGEN